MFDEVDEGHADNEERVIFRYNREERIANAPQIVQDYYAGKMTPVRGFKVLVANKSNRFILIALIFFVAAVWLYTGLNNTRSSTKINNILFELQGFSYEDEIYTFLKIIDKEADENSKPVDISATFFFINNDNQVANKEDFSMIYRDGEKYFRTKYSDYDILRIDAVVSVDGIEKEMSTIVKR